MLKVVYRECTSRICIYIGEGPAHKRGNAIYILTAKPTAPSPKMTTVDPFSTLAVFHAAPTPSGVTAAPPDRIGVSNTISHVLSSLRLAVLCPNSSPA